MKKILYSKESLEKALEGANSIADICRNLGIKPIGGNYNTVARNCKKFGIDISLLAGQEWNKGHYLDEVSLNTSLDEILKENVNFKSSQLKKD